MSELKAEEGIIRGAGVCGGHTILLAGRTRPGPRGRGRRGNTWTRLGHYAGLQENRPQATPEKAKRVPGAELWHLPSKRQIPGWSRLDLRQLNYGSVSLQRFPSSPKGQTYVSEGAARQALTNSGVPGRAPGATPTGI